MAAQTTVAVLGTGIMGSGMARSLLRAGLQVRVWNRTRERAEPLAASGAEVSATPADAVRGAAVVLTILSDGPAVAAVLRDAAPNLHTGQVLMQSSTVGTVAVGELAATADELGLLMVDAPVLGTRQPAEAGKLTVLAAGPDAARAILAPVLAAVAARTVWLADAADGGAATRLKLVVNSWVLALVSGVAEALSLARGLSIDPELFLDVMAGGPMDSQYLQSKGAAMLAGDFAPNFALSSAAKDARLIVADAERAGLRLDVANAVAARFARAAADGHGGDDMAATYLASAQR